MSEPDITPLGQRLDVLDRRVRQLQILVVVTLLFLLGAGGMTAFLLSRIAPGSTRGHGGTWVLWREGRTWGLDMTPAEWVLIAVHDARDPCTTELKTFVGKLAADAGKDPSEGRVRKNVEITDDAVAVTFFAKTGSPNGGVSSRFYCLPDTVDPRGPKGKE